MQRELWFLFFTVILVMGGLFAPAALAADDDGMRLFKEQAATGAAAPRADDTGPLVDRYLVTFIKSRTTDPIRTATVVSVTNQTSRTCHVSIEWFRGFDPTLECTTTFNVDAGFQIDFCSRQLPDSLTTCNATCAPDLTFHEGKAVVSANCEQIGVSARVYYTRGSADDEVAAISDSKIVRFDEGNRGD
jgi:hypothetical protein